MPDLVAQLSHANEENGGLLKAEIQRTQGLAKPKGDSLRCHSYRILHHNSLKTTLSHVVQPRISCAAVLASTDLLKAWSPLCLYNAYICLQNTP